MVSEKWQSAPQRSRRSAIAACDKWMKPNLLGGGRKVNANCRRGFASVSVQIHAKISISHVPFHRQRENDTIFPVLASIVLFATSIAHFRQCFTRHPRHILADAAFVVSDCAQIQRGFGIPACAGYTTGVAVCPRPPLGDQPLAEVALFPVKAAVAVSAARTINRRR